MDTIRPWLAIGDFADTYYRDKLDENGITAMLQLAVHRPQPGIDTYFLPIIDAEQLPNGALAEGMAYIHEQRAARQKVLVACAAGISRSATFCVAALKEAEGLTLTEAYRDLRKYHPISAPHPALWTSLCDYYPDEPPYSELWASLLVGE